MPRAYSVDLREKALQALTSGRSVAETARFFGVSQKSLYRWRTQQQTSDSLAPRTPPGRPRLFSPAQDIELEAQVAACPDATLDELRATLSVTISRSTMSRNLKRLGLTRKKESDGNRAGSGATCSLAT